MDNQSGFIKIRPGLWYEEATGKPWSSKQKQGLTWSDDGPLRPLLSLTDGYPSVSLVVNGKRTTLLWHRVVWEHFNGTIPEDKEVDHKDHNRENPLVSNLQLLTPQKNKQKISGLRKRNYPGYPGVYWNKPLK